MRIPKRNLIPTNVRCKKCGKPLLESELEIGVCVECYEIPAPRCNPLSEYCLWQNNDCSKCPAKDDPNYKTENKPSEKQ